MLNSGKTMSMHVHALPSGRYSVHVVQQNSVPLDLGDFATIQEAEAWVMKQMLAGVESFERAPLLRPNPNLDLV